MSSDFLPLASGLVGIFESWSARAGVAIRRASSIPQPRRATIAARKARVGRDGRGLLAVGRSLSNIARFIPS